MGSKGQMSNRYIVNFNNPSTLVSVETLPSVTGDTPRDDSPDTPPSVTGDTQSRITINKNNHNKNLLFKKEKKMNDVTSGYQIDGELLK